MELLIGAGSNRARQLSFAGQEEWTGLVTLDINSDHKPDVVWDLNILPLPFEDNSCDSISAFEVLEHLGTQGDWRFFFLQWFDFWRILKPDGLFFGTCPASSSPWVWGDPSHTRYIGPESLVFLSQPNYEQVGITPMSDFRFFYKADFDLIHSHTSEHRFEFVLRAVKPSRVTSG